MFILILFKTTILSNELFLSHNLLKTKERMVSIIDNKININKTNNVLNSNSIQSEIDIFSNNKSIGLFDSFINDNSIEYVDTKSINNNDSINIDKNDIVLNCKYKYADKCRYTITGSPPSDSSNIKVIPTIITSGIVAGVFIAQHLYQMNTIWDEQSEFKIYEDGQYALYADKLGHFYGSYLTSYLSTEVLMSMGFEWHASNIIGALMGLSYSTYVEIMDGYGESWGFCPSDFYADVAGSVFYILQHYIPVLQNFTPKFMYIPAPWHGELHRIPSTMFIDDYSSHTLWMSVNVYNLLPEHLKKYWLPWLDISFGYAVRNLCSPHKYKCDPCRSEPVSIDTWGNRKFIIALDYDLVKLLPEGPGFCNWLKQSLNYFKLPSPAIEFGSETKFYLLYPFPIY